MTFFFLLLLISTHCLGARDFQFRTIYKCAIRLIIRSACSSFIPGWQMLRLRKLTNGIGEVCYIRHAALAFSGRVVSRGFAFLFIRRLWSMPNHRPLYMIPYVWLPCAVLHDLDVTKWNRYAQYDAVGIMLGGKCTYD